MSNLEHQHELNLNGKKSPHFREYLCAIRTTLIVFCGAVPYGWTAPTLPKLYAENGDFVTVTKEEGSWIASVISVGSIVGQIINLILVDRVGRKPMLIAATVPFILAWILVIVASDVYHLYAFRILCGLGVGIAFSTTPIYLGEIGSDAVRGSVGIMFTVMALSGILYTYSIAPYVSIQAFGYFALIPIALFLATFLFNPESPYFLQSKNKPEKAFKSLAWFRETEEVKDEFEVLQRLVKESQSEDRGNFFSVQNFKPILIIVQLGAAQHFSGSQAIIFYSTQIFQEAQPSLNPNLITIILGAVQVIVAIFATTIIEKFGRRGLLLTSITGCTICNFGVATYFYMISESDSADLSWIPITLIIAFIVSDAFGLAPVPTAILGEIFPMNMKAIATVIYGTSTAIFGFTVWKSFQYIISSYGMHTAFFLYGGSSFVFLVTTYFLLPETKGKSIEVILEEIKTFRVKK